ncbi:Kiwa anti-phage protein KwaB-like domain-containing protein [Rhizomicrobium electricum]|uniref:Kiwa anti-phage protein KwaB-like domain-containing protein n=1 Tax=Rhizomicrobium electricum TaxID=480070 RepID=UPI0014211D30|nr:Kiwa anti-phage protein KwaB-like domain-containing protein [Rhizomicrobium electricum]NIJ48349.1 hypothetical protein [Rhizomicrobium electricum]
MLSKAGKEPHEKWKRVRWARDLERDYRKLLAGSLLETTRTEMVRPYSFEGMVEGGLGYWSLDKLQAEKPWPYYPPELDWRHVFDGSEPHFSKIELLVSVVKFATGRELICYRRQSSNALAKRPSRLTAVLDPTEHIFRKPSGSIFQLDYRTDFFLWDGHIFILRQSVFESLTHIIEATEAKATAALGNIASSASVSIDRFDEFRKAVLARGRSRKRLASAEQNGILSEINADQIEACIAEVGLSIRRHREGEKLVLSPNLESGSELDDLVKVLVDYFTRGLSSKAIYATDVKHRLR